VRIDQVGTENGDHHVDIVTKTIREARTQRTIDQSTRQDGLIAGATLSAKERTWDFSSGIHPLLNVHREWEEVDTILWLLASGGRCEHHGIAKLGHNSSMSLRGKKSGFKTNQGIHTRELTLDTDCRHISPYLRLLILKQTRLTAQAKTGYQSTVALNVLVTQVVEKSSTPSNHHHQSTARVMVTLVHLEMLSKLSYPVGKDGDLNLWGTGITLTSLIARNDILLGRHT
jgi:hypothetical protein